MMILLDPDLEPDRTLAPAIAKRSAASVPEKNLRIPSRRTLGRYLSQAQAAVGLRGQVTVLLTTDATIRDLNRRFRGKDTATDVLSFPAANLAQNQDRSAGDLAISVDTVRRQAGEQDHSLATELKVIILHGLLHLTGLDHASDSGRMLRREIALRKKLRLPQGLIERAGAGLTTSRRRKP